MTGLSQVVVMAAVVAFPLDLIFGQRDPIRDIFTLACFAAGAWLVWWYLDCGKGRD